MLNVQTLKAHRTSMLAAVGVFCAAVASAQTITTVVGGGSTYLANNIAASSAKLYGPTAVATDSNGNYYFADCNPSTGYGCVIYKVTVSTGIINIVAGTGAAGYTGDGGAATSATFSTNVRGLTVAPSGNVYISDGGYCVIRKVTIPSGSTTGTIATYAGSNSTKTTSCGGSSGDGGAATSAFLYFPSGIYTTSSTLYIADLMNHRVRAVSASTGKISTVAGDGTSGYTGDGGAATSAELVSPTGVALDTNGNIYITDQGSNNSNSDVREVSASTGYISTFAGGTGVGSGGDGGAATSAKLDVPKNLAVDSSNNVYVADTYNNKIRKVTSGTINTYAGNGSEGFTGDGGAATSAEMNLPYAVAADGSGNIYIADYQNARIRMVN